MRFNSIPSPMLPVRRAVAGRAAYEREASILPMMRHASIVTHRDGSFFW
jgi:hypothetical protein